MTKLYTNEAVANKVLGQKNKKIEDAAQHFKLVQVTGGWNIVGPNDTAPVVEEQTSGTTTETTTEVVAADPISMTFTEAKETANYVIVKATGTNSGGRERWFEKKRLASFTVTNGTAVLVADPKVFSSRKIAA